MGRTTLPHSVTSASRLHRVFLATFDLRPNAEASDHMGGSDKRKQSLYFPEEMLKEIQEEATRQDRSLSWIVQKAWKISRKEIMKYPSVNEFPGEEDERGAVE